MGVFWFDGPAPVSLPLLSLDPMMVLDQHVVQHEGVSKTVPHAMEIGPYVGDLLWW